MSSSPPLKVVSARENNLKSLNFELEHDNFTVITGLSGSGKSSLAFGTIYAEGQRRYIETFSPYVRQFFDKVKKPDVDLIENVRPAIAIQQRTRITSSRSTVGSMTHVNDYLKILWSNLSQAICPFCKSALQNWTPQSLAHHILEIVNEEIFTVGAKINLSTERERLEALGFTRFEKDIVIIERFKRNNISFKRLQSAIEQAFSLTPGRCIVLGYKEFGGACCDKMPTLPPQRPALFSFNHPFGACGTCKGFGAVLDIDINRCVPDPSKSLRDKCFVCWSSKGTRWEYGHLLKFCEKYGISVDTAWRDLPEQHKELILTKKEGRFYGLFPWFKWLERKAYKMHVRVLLSKFRTQKTCPDCNGTRLKREALAYLIQNKTISDAWNMSISDLLCWLEAFSKSKQFTRQIREIFTPLLSRLNYLNNLGLSYLTLDRQARTLSGGETQRVNLAAALGSDLTSTHFILDEPSVGLHPRDTERLISTVRSLHNKGNSVTVVEHDPDFIDAAEEIIELGPESGDKGGEIIFQGPRKKWPGLKLNLPALKQQNKISDRFIAVKNATVRNLESFNVAIPVNQFVCITGVSGSGKSTLAKEVIFARRFVDGLEQFSDVLLVDQSALAKSPRANIATYSGIWEYFRNRLAETDEARLRSLTKSSFSFNVDGGRCKACSGAGFIREDMQFLSDVYIPCEVCLGKRFKQTVLEIHYKGLNVDQLLNLSIDSCAELFGEEKQLKSPLSTLQILGLGHLKLGHPLSELSGGEAQRLKLVSAIKGLEGTEIDPQTTKPYLLIFDEPTTGLHVKDVEKLIKLFQTLKSLGHSVLCIEHNLLLIAASDWIIDLGPEGGEGGGRLVAEGSPSTIISRYKTHTAQHLKRFVTMNVESYTNGSKRKKLDPFIRISGAREHNLKDINIDIPLNQFVAITGVSGSGKSTIAKDIIFAEGQRRYLDCLSPYARQFIRSLEKPDIDHISNILPTICVYQHTFQPGYLSTVGTMSEVYNFLRLLFAKMGVQYCPDHPQCAIQGTSAEEIAAIIQKSVSSSIRILSPIIRKKKGIHRTVFERAIQSEISEVRVDDVIAKPSQFLDGLDKSKSHSIDFVVARCNPGSIDRDMLRDAVSMALSLSNGEAVIITEKEELVFSTERTCPKCKKGFFKPDPEDLSFHSTRGRCKKCNGEGGNCVECEGARINKLGRNLRINGKNIYQASLLAPAGLLSFLGTVSENALTTPILRELRARVNSLIGMGIEYLPLARGCETLSGGELQRLRIATALGSPLTGVLYIFDEPSAGLHPYDNTKVLELLRNLTEKGNSILMIEHDLQSIRASDYVIDVGPGGGRNGGTIVYAGPTKKAALAKIDLPLYLPDKPKKWLKIKSASKNNIKNLSFAIPLNKLVTVVGVSGSGKSSLVHGIIAEQIQSPKLVDQKPIGANARSTPASYLKIWDEIRKLFAKTTEAEIAGRSASYFSYNSGKGRCPECKGLGHLKLEMSFLPDAKVPCESCNGARYTDEALSIRYRGFSIKDILDLTFEEAKSVFAHHRKIHQVLHNACELGLGYLTLGQSSTTLSGGESQRIKLVAELGSRLEDGDTTYILDEPTTGLHRSDVARLIAVLRELVRRGNSVIVIEHDSDVIQSSDYLIEMGEGAGDAGGRIIFEGLPTELRESKTPWGMILHSLNVPNVNSQTQAAAHL